MSQEFPLPDEQDFLAMTEQLPHPKEKIPSPRPKKSFRNFLSGAAFVTTLLSGSPFASAQSSLPIVQQEEQQFTLNGKRVAPSDLGLRLNSHYQPFPVMDSDGKIYSAFASLSTENGETKQGFLITDQNSSIVQDPEAYRRAAFTARYAKMARDGLPQELRARASDYRRILDQTELADFTINVGTEVTQHLFGLLFYYGTGEGKQAAEEAKKLGEEALKKLEKEQLKEIRKNVSDDLRKEIAVELFKRAQMVKAENPQIDSDEAFTRVMRKMLRDSAQELEQVAGRLEALNYPSVGSARYSDIVPISQGIIENLSRGYAIPFALSKFYAGDSGWDTAKNFLVRHVISPALEAGVDIVDITTVIDIESLIKTFPPAMEEFTRRVAFMRGLIEDRFGESERAIDLFKEYSKKEAENVFRQRLKGAGAEGFLEAYRSLRAAALRDSSTIQDKINYVFFLTGLLNSLSLRDVLSPEDWERSAEIQKEFLFLPPEEFVRKYDRLARRMIQEPENRKYAAAFASVAGLLEPFVRQATQPPPGTVYHPPAGQPFDSSQMMGLYDQWVSRAESELSHYQNFLDQNRGSMDPSQASGLEETLRRNRSRISTLKTYRPLFQSGLSSGSRQAVLLYLQQMMGDLGYR